MNNNQQFITGQSTSKMKSPRACLLPRPSTFTFPINLYTSQGTAQPFITGPYLPIQYIHQQQKISPKELNFITTCFPVITVTLTDQLMNSLANQVIFVKSTSILCFKPLELSGNYQKTQMKIVKVKTVNTNSISELNMICNIQSDINP